MANKIYLRNCPKCGKPIDMKNDLYLPSRDWHPTMADPDSGGDCINIHHPCGLDFSTGTYDWDEFVKAWNDRPVTYIYMLYAISAKENTKAEILKKYNAWKELQKDQTMADQQIESELLRSKYLELMKTFKDDCRYSMDEELIGCYLTKKDATQAAVSNICDYNDGGCYNYSIIKKIETNYTYPEASFRSEYNLYRYHNNAYQPLQLKGLNEMEQAIMQTYNPLYNRDKNWYEKAEKAFLDVLTEKQP